MRKYSKSREQYKRERGRRKKVLELSQEGCTQQEIAKKLHISRRTVARDFKKLHNYIEVLKFKEKQRIDGLLHECMQKIPLQIRYSILAQMWDADRDIQWRWMKAIIARDVPRLKLMLLRARRGDD